jgi:hypothetical protein
MMKLGKHAPKNDPRTLRLAHYLLPSLPAAPLSSDWGTKIERWGMMRNDAVGDCTCATAGHMIETWSSVAGSLRIITDAEVIKAYSAVSGYDPATGANDNGAVEVDVLNYWRKTGIGGHKIGAYAAVNPKNPDHVKAGCWLFGGLYLGLALPLSAQSQDVWDVARRNGRAGSWGGHAVNVVAYDKNALTCVTWGARKQMTWRFFEKYCDEAYALISSDWVNGKKKAPSGFDLAALQADLNALDGKVAA